MGVASAVWLKARIYGYLKGGRTLAGIVVLVSPAARTYALGRGDTPRLRRSTCSGSSGMLAISARVRWGSPQGRLHSAV